MMDGQRRFFIANNDARRLDGPKGWIRVNAANYTGLQRIAIGEFKHQAYRTKRGDYWVPISRRTFHQVVKLARRERLTVDRLINRMVIAAIRAGHS